MQSPLKCQICFAHKLTLNEVNQPQSNSLLNEALVNAIRESADATLPTITISKQSPPGILMQKYKNYSQRKPSLLLIIQIKS